LAEAVGEVESGYYPAYLDVVQVELVADEGGEGLDESGGEVVGEVGQDKEGQKPGDRAEKLRLLDGRFPF
jgi:hypothetical protein